MWPGKALRESRMIVFLTNLQSYGFSYSVASASNFNEILIDIAQTKNFPDFKPTMNLQASFSPHMLIETSLLA